MSDQPKLRIKLLVCDVEATGYVSIIVGAIIATAFLALFAYLAIFDPAKIGFFLAGISRRDSSSSKTT